MPELVARRSVDLPLSRIWPFVADYGNWAPMLPGYESHEVESETDSIWTLRGDLGPMSRTVRMRVHVTEWRDQERVAFQLIGIDEQVTGSGAFDLSSDAPPPPPPRTFVQRLLDWLLRRRPPKLLAASKSHVTFTFQIAAGGPMGPMVDAMLGPYAEHVANELLERVGAHLETAAMEAA